MSGAPFESIWNAMPYPALLICPDDRIRAANPAAESAVGMSLRQMAN